ncbi:MAG: DUF4255 domain-containing protein [Spirochaetota bacterium]|nr:DUF4255 domain-containing protein [Spirochaetota bacterium]
MANNTILRDISSAFKLQIYENLSELKHSDGSSYITSQDSISLKSPGEDLTGVQLSLFLYKLSENTYLRNSAAQGVQVDMIRKAPLTVDLHYLITPNISDKYDELMVIERIMQSLFETPALDKLYFTASLKNTGNDDIKIQHNELSLDELNKLWSIFPNTQYKLSLSYIVSPVRIPLTPEPIRRVEEYIIGRPL